MFNFIFEEVLSMKIMHLLFMLFLAASTASASEKSILVFATGYDSTRPSAVSILQRADYASMTVTISSDQKEPVEQFQELSIARQALIQEAKKNPKILVHTGPVSLSPESKSSLMKVSYSAGSDATVTLLYSLAENKGDVFQAARELAGLAKGMKATGKASYRFSTIRLAVDTPEKYRPKLLQMIFDDIKQARLLAKKSGKVMITGLNHPVLVRQADDAHVELFLDYAASMELPAE